LIGSMRKKAAEYREDSLSVLSDEELNSLRNLLQTLKTDLSSKL